jgi:hypothetical protein
MSLDNFETQIVMRVQNNLLAKEGKYKARWKN